MKDIKKEIHEELKEIAPSFSKMEKKDGFEIPENYFKELPDQILSQLDFPKTSVATKASWMDVLMEKINALFQPKIAVGFAMTMLLMFSIYFFTNKTTTTPDIFAEISLDEMEAYVKENIDDFDEEILLDFMAENEMNLDNLSEEDLDEYMNDIIDDLDDSDLEEFL